MTVPPRAIGHREFFNPIAGFAMNRKPLFALILSLLTVTPALAGDFLIRDAQLVDGTGAPPRRADIRVAGDKIAAIGELKPNPGETVVDAHGLALAPGFIDTHSHHDRGLENKLDALPVVSQGITTIVVGQDGSSTIPLADFFRAIEAKPAAMNIASYSGHNDLRDKVLGDDFKRKATPAEVEKMRRLLAADMEAGALGLSTGLEYDPGIYSDRSEVLTLAREAAKHGGRYISHMRSEDRDLWAALNELVNIGREAKLPVQVSHAKLAMTDWWGQADRFLAVLDKARAEGIDATLDVYPYPNWQSTLTVLWPKRDFSNRETAEFVLKHLAPADGLLISAFTPDPSLVGKTVADVARQRGTDAPAAAMALIREAEAAKGEVHVIGTSMDERDIAKLIAWPQANISSDGQLEDLHPRGAGAFTRVLRVYVREKKKLTLEEAVRKMSGLAAKHMGLTDRGEIRVGAAADLVLFDPATVADRSTPKDSSALSVGIARVWVNGALVYLDGKATGAHPGRALRRQPR
jgi:N-acyl-D-amino-acid deacylase